MESRIQGTDYLKQLKALIDNAKKNLAGYSEIINLAVANGSKGSKAASIDYLVALSELARVYSGYNLDGNIEQLINFLTIAETVASVQKGILLEDRENKTFNLKNELYNSEYAQILKESTNPSNFPHSPNEYTSKMVGVLSEQDSLAEHHKSDVSDYRKMVFPEDLLQRATSQPFLDKDGNSFSTILEFINHRIELQKGIDETNSATVKK